MKKYLTIFLALGILTACSDKTEENTPDNTAAAETPAPRIDYAQKSFHFSKDSLTAGCEDDSEIICAINLAVKCSINPKFAECDKSKMPKFILWRTKACNDRPNPATKLPSSNLLPKDRWKSIPKANATASGLACVTATSSM